MSYTLVTVAGIGLVVGMALIVAGGRSARWADASRDLGAQLIVTAKEAGDVTRPRPDDVPAPVRRYLDLVLPPGQAPIRSIELEQEAEFFVPIGGGGWKPLHATQRFTTRPAGFVWDARIRMMPLVPVYVLDSYVAGTGSTRASLAGAYSLTDVSGDGVNPGALQRFLGESVWFPTVLASPQVSWRPIDDATAVATLADGSTTVSLEFRFDEAGYVYEVYAPDRLREVNGSFQPTPWLVKCGRYEMHHGIKIPVECEVSWLMPGGPEPYWRGRVTTIRYAF